METGNKVYKGFEQLSRETLQNNEISLAARGLLANIASYHENWVIRKTEVRTRFATESPKAVDRYWDELVAHNYIIQFRKRDGQKYIYKYFYSVNKFTVQELANFINEAYQDLYYIYHKEMNKSQNSNIFDFIFISDDEKPKLGKLIGVAHLDLSKSTSPTNAVKSTNFGLPFSTCPNRQSNKDLNKRYLTKDIDDDDLYIPAQKNQAKTGQGTSVPKNQVNTLVLNHQNNEFTESTSPTNVDKTAMLESKGIAMTTNRDDIAQYFQALNNDTLYKTDALLQQKSVSQNDRKKIIILLSNLPHLHNLKLIQEQINWCETKAQETSISNYPSYFLAGLKQRYVMIKDNSKYDHFVIPV